MIYRKTETFEGVEPYTYLVDINPDDAFPHDGNVRSVSFDKVGFHDVTTDELLSLLETEMEYGNLPLNAYLVTVFAARHIESTITPIAAKQVLWNMIEDKGSTLGL